MIKNKLRIDIIRKNLKEDNRLCLRGWFDLGRPDSIQIRAFFDDLEAECTYLFRPNVNPDAQEAQIDIDLLLPEGDFKKFTLNYYCYEEVQTAVELSSEKLLAKLEEPNRYIDAVLQLDGETFIRGWLLSFDSKSLVVKDAKGNEIPVKTEWTGRNDILGAFPELDSYQGQPGFTVNLGQRDSETLQLFLTADGHTAVETIDLKAMLGQRNSLYYRALNYYRKNGGKRFFEKAGSWINDKLHGKETEYETWMRKNDPSKEELEAQRAVTFETPVKFSLVMPVYNTPVEYLTAMIDSVVAQTYTDWELNMADGSSNDRLMEYFAGHPQDGRVHYQKLEENLGIAGNTNAALEMATGDYIVLVDHDDLLPENALFEMRRVIDAHEDAEVIYSDEDKIDFDGKTRYEPHFKSDFNPDLLCSVNYICHLFAVKRDLQQEVGGFDPAYDGAQDHDFILRCTENAKNVYHIPKILYHWRCHMNSTAENPEHKLYAFESGKAAVKAYYKRRGMEVEVKDGPFLGTYHPVIPIQGNPLVSILIPTKDHIDDLEKCLKSIYEKTDYPNFEIIVIENNSENSETFAYYDKIKDTHKNLQVVTWEAGFNFSAINNFGANFAKGEYLLFLNNDTEVIHPEWLREMVSYCQRPEVGIVGAKLLYPDNTVQHAGVVIGMGGIAGHVGLDLPADAAGYFFRSVTAQDYSAVTAACLLTKRADFDAVGGMNEDLEVAFNDIDYCMRIRSLGHLVVFNPEAKLYHYESKSRGAEDTPEKVLRFQKEIAKFRDLWPEILTQGDPYYNPNLTLNMPGYKIKL